MSQSLPTKHSVSIAFIVVLLVSALFPFVPTAQANVSLGDFSATLTGPTEVEVRWNTETETDMVAFLIKRGATNSLADAVVVRTEPARGSATGGAEYSYTDTLPASGQYTYWLFEVKSNLREEELASTSVGAGATTSTPTASPTSTTTTQQQQPTATPTRPVQATNTPPSNVEAPTNTPPATNTPPGNNVVPTDTPPAPTNTPPGNTQVQAATNTPPAATAAPIAVDAAQPAQEATSVAPLADTQAVSPDAAAATAGTTAIDTPTAELFAGATAEAGESALAPDTERLDQTDLSTTAVEPTVQAVAQAGQTNEPATTQDLAARPTATPRPSGDSQPSNASSLLLVVGGGTVCGAALLALVAIFVWRRR